MLTGSAPGEVKQRTLRASFHGRGRWARAPLHHVVGDLGVQPRLKRKEGKADWDLQHSQQRGAIPGPSLLAKLSNACRKPSDECRFEFRILQIPRTSIIFWPIFKNVRVKKVFLFQEN